MLPQLRWSAFAAAVSSPRTSKTAHKPLLRSKPHKRCRRTPSRCPPALIESVAQLEAIPIDKWSADPEDRYEYYPRQGEEAKVVNPEPTHVLRIHAYLEPATPKGADADGFEDEPTEGFEDERAFTEAEFAVGVHEGKYYFCTIRHD